jgi:glycosyltransferase involved in cell wall biosynthesis
MGDAGLKTKLVSIIVPVYNTSLYLGKCIESILAQTYSLFELILVDDGSIDDSGFICDTYAAKDERVKVLHQENQGVTNSRINGFSASSGEFISFIDSDDYVEPNMLEKLIAAMDKNESEMAVCQYYNDSGGLISKSVIRPLPGVYDKKKIEILLQTNALYDSTTRIAGMPFFLCGKIYKRSIIPLILKTGKDLWYEEDLVGILAALYSIDKMAVIPDYLYYYVTRPGQTIATFKSDILNNYLKVIGKIEEIDVDSFLQNQLPTRVLNEVCNILAICIRNTHQYSLFKKVFIDIANNVVIKDKFKELTRNLDFKGKIKLTLITHKLAFMYYFLTLMKEHI